MNKTQVDQTMCFHCGLPVADPQRWTITLAHKTESLCCPGCQSVANAILAGGLENYYRFRSALAVKGDESIANDITFLAYDDPVIQRSFVHALDANEAEAQLFLEDIHCAACCWLIEHAVGKRPGLLHISINLSTHKALLRWNPAQQKLSDIVRHIHAVGYRVLPFRGDTAQQLEKIRRRDLLRIGVAGIGMMQAMMFALALYSGDFSGIDPEHKQFMRWFSLLVTLPVLFYSGQTFFQGAWRSLKGKRFGMDVPVSMALLIAFFASVHAVVFKTGEVYFDSISMFIFLLLLARYAESSARRQLWGSQSSSLLPLTCQRLAGKPETVSLAQVVVGDTIMVRAGETIPLDGCVLEGCSTVNEAAFTGEPIPLLKQTGDTVYAGTINGDDMLLVCVSSLAGSTRLDTISHLAENAEAQKPRLNAWVDTVANGFTLFVLLLAAGAGIFWQLHGGANTLAIVLSILVVSCPCALSLATPSALAFCYQALRRRGILVTRQDLIAPLRRTNRVVFDKTGTLTTGRFSITSLTLFSSAHDNEAENKIRELAAALERYSGHPMAAAFRNTATNLVVSQVQLVSGQGVEGLIGDQRLRIGSRTFCTALTGTDLPQGMLEERTEQRVYLASDQGWLACFRLQDTLREGASEVVRALQQAGKQVEILSGDASGAAEQLAQRLGITVCYSAMSAEQKLQHIRTLQTQGHTVMMVGDGINDIPVLAQADVSVAMNSASDLAKIKADAILLQDTLQPLSGLFQHGAKTEKIIIQNLSWALLYNAIALPLAAMGLVAPWLAAAGMSFSSLLVTLNSLRLRKIEEPGKP